jgi:hypothetical protein
MQALGTEKPTYFTDRADILAPPIPENKENKPFIKPPLVRSNGRKNLFEKMGVAK